MMALRHEVQEMRVRREVYLRVLEELLPEEEEDDWWDEIDFWPDFLLWDPNDEGVVVDEQEVPSSTPDDDPWWWFTRGLPDVWVDHDSRTVGYHRTCRFSGRDDIEEITFGLPVFR